MKNNSWMKLAKMRLLTSLRMPRTTSWIGEALCTYQAIDKLMDLGKELKETTDPGNKRRPEREFIHLIHPVRFKPHTSSPTTLQRYDESLDVPHHILHAL